jgi:HlyD family secretion protein
MIRVLFVVFAGIILATAAMGCAPSAPASDATADDLVSRLGRLESVHLLTGTLRAVQSEVITVPRTQQRRVTIQWLVEDGAEVSEGDLLVEFDNTLFTTNLEEKETAVISARRSLDQALAQADAGLIESEIALRQARINLQKAELDSRVPTGLRSEYEDQQATLALERARSALAKAEADQQAAVAAGTAETAIARENLATAEKELDEAEASIEKLRINAPDDGLALVSVHPWEGRRHQVGDTLWMGLPVVEMPILDRMRVEAFLSDVDDGLVSVGDPVRCVLDATPEREFFGTIDSISSAARTLRFDSLRRFFEVSIVLHEADPDVMRPGMSVRVEVPLTFGEEAVIVPRATVVHDGEIPGVRLAGGTIRTVTLGPCSVRECAIENGLEAGIRLEVAS